MDRRKFMTSTAAAASALATTSAGAPVPTVADKPAVRGGTPVRKQPFPSWPVEDETEEKALLAVLRSGKWNRGNGGVVDRFEAAYSKLMGSQRCLATANGTSSLLVALNTLGVGAGDEVIVPPYTFVATINAVLQVGAIPIFVDSDRSTLQIDAKKIEAAVTPRTVAIMPVHLGGNVADLDTILAVANRHNV